MSTFDREPRIFESEAPIRLVGLGEPFIPLMSPESNAPQVIGPLWKRFFARAEAVKWATEDRYGCITAVPGKQSHPHELFYFVGGVVADGASEVPAGMRRETIPPARWAAFRMRGDFAELPTMLHHIFFNWMPSSPWDHAGMDVEFYRHGDEELFLEYRVQIAAKVG